MIKIGVSACFMYPDPNRPFFSTKQLCYLENDMANYLYRHDVIPILIPDLNNSVEHLLAQMDGFVFQGGVDLSPKTYGAKHLNIERWPGDEKRDQYELKIADFAFKQGKPMLGICRGAQLLNAYFGGTLYQDIATEYETSLQHRDAQQYDKIFHAIKFTPGLHLAEIYKNESKCHVNSVHHQSIKKLGENLIIEAISPKDNIIEAFSHRNMHDNFVLAVQWHPEFSHTLSDKVIAPEPIYDYFLQHIRSKR